jgi:hypothetical protein
VPLVRSDGDTRALSVQGRVPESDPILSSLSYVSFPFARSTASSRGRSRSNATVSRFVCRSEPPEVLFRTVQNGPFRAPSAALSAAATSSACSAWRPTLGSSSSSRRCSATVRGLPGCLSALSVSHSKHSLYGGFVWARRALNRLKRRFPARAVPACEDDAAKVDMLARTRTVRSCVDCQLAILPANRLAKLAREFPR